MHIFRHWPLYGFLLVGLFMAPAIALAGESYDNCTGFVDSLPATISTQGTWCLRGDLATGIFNGSAITINTNNVTLDCNHFKVGGLAGGLATEAKGIAATNKENTTIRNCNIRGFYYGVSMLGGGGHLVENNRLDGNTVTGIYVSHGPSTIRGNTVLDTGWSSTTYYAVGIFASNGVDIIDNTVNGVAADGLGQALGIWTELNGNGSVTGNRVRGLSPSGDAPAYGIYNMTSGRMVARDNDVQGTGSAASIGIWCSSNAATARDNVVAGFATPLESRLSTGNTLNIN